MALTELLLVVAAILAALSGAIFILVLVNQRPRYRRGREASWARVNLSSSALLTHIPRRRDEGSSLLLHSPRTRSAVLDGSVADVVDDTWVSGAEGLLSR